jgi:two-component system, sensor histidine kinase and response regulator
MSSRLKTTARTDVPADAVMATDNRGRIVDWNAQAEALFGWPLSAAAGKTPAALLLPPGDSRTLQLDCARLLSAAQPLNVHRFELTVVRRDGGELPIELTLLPIRESSSSKVYLLIRDLRLFKQEEQAFEARLLHQVATLASETNSFEDALQCSIDVVCEMTGWPIGHALLLPDVRAQALVSTDLWHFGGEGDFAALKEATNQIRFAPGVGLPGLIWQSGEPAWIANLPDKPGWRRTELSDSLDIKGAFGLPIRIMDETVAILEFYTREDMAPDAQLLLAVQGVGAQVGRVIERKRAEEERARLAAIIDSSYDAVIGMTLEGAITSWNVGAERLYGYTPEEAVGCSMALLIPNELDDEGERILETLRRGRRLEQFETVRRRRDGREIHVSLTASPIMNADGRVIGAAAIERDITGRIRVQNDLQTAKEAAEIANRAKSEFLANISHELRTPMNAIIGMTQLALSEDLSPVVRDYLETAEDSAHVLLHLLNDILDFSRFESGKFQMDQMLFPLRETLAESIKTLAVRAREKNLDLTCDVADDVPDGLIGDPVRLGQIILNLVGNAVKFTERGTVAVTVRVDSQHTDEVCLHFSIRDTGIGISLQDQQRIFTPFTQADSSTTRHFGGTGLGLAICQELTDLMQGRLWVESEVDCGSTFHFTARFPLPTDEELQAAHVRKQGEKLHGYLGPAADRGANTRHVLEADLDMRRPLRVLLAEDTPANQKMVKSIVEKRGHSIEVAQNGREAVDLFQLGEFDVVLMDVQMPLIDGFQATGIIRSMEQSVGRKTPIVALTAHVMHGDRERCLAAGMDAYISKPIHPRSLIELIESLSNLFTEGELIEFNNSATQQCLLSSSNDGKASQATNPIFNLRATLERLGHDEKLLYDIVRFFLEDSPGMLDEIRRGIENRDAEQVTRVAHSLKGLAANFSARDAVEAALIVERRGRADDFTAAREGLTALVHEIDRLNAALEQLLADRDKPIVADG